MTIARPGPLLRRTLTHHILLTVLVVVALSALTSLGIWRYAQDDARRTAEKIAHQIAAAVLVPMSQRDFADPAGFARQPLLADLTPFLRSGMIDRVKVFTIRSGTARIVFSDEPSIEGRTGTLRPELATRLDRGEIVVQPVPDDPEHASERGLPGERLEVYIGFRDAGGHDTRMEMYVPVSVAEVTWHAVAVLVPVIAAGLLAIGLATVPLSVALARRMERDRAEQRAVRDYGLAAAELARRDVAQRLHDGVIPELAGASLLLEGLQAEAVRGGPPHWELIGRAQSVVADDIVQLRTLLDDLVPDDAVTSEPAASLRELVERAVRLSPAQAPDVVVDVSVDPGMSPDTAVLVRRVAGELVRNAVRHAGARSIRLSLTTAPGSTVELVVVDDGAGFDTGAARRSGHVGLQLVQNVVRDNGGTTVVESCPGSGTIVRVIVPDRLRPREARGG